MAIKTTVLKFPKDLFTKKEVAKVPKGSFRFPSRWELGKTRKDWTLTFKAGI